jgi:molybdopterin converting factor small subunit
MSTTVRIPTPLRTLTGGNDEVSADGRNVGELIDNLEKKHPGIRDRLLDEKGVRRFVNYRRGDIRFWRLRPNSERRHGVHRSRHCPRFGG